MRRGIEGEGDGGLSALNFVVFGQDLVEKLWHCTIVQNSSSHHFASCGFQTGGGMALKGPEHYNRGPSVIRLESYIITDLITLI